MRARILLELELLASLQILREMKLTCGGNFSLLNNTHSSVPRDVDQTGEKTLAISGQGNKALK